MGEMIGSDRNGFLLWCRLLEEGLTRDDECGGCEGGLKVEQELLALAFVTFPFIIIPCEQAKLISNGRVHIGETGEEEERGKNKSMLLVCFCW
ncbi:hypothetical protein LIER_27195 [Lithospermum erythrorhizon]|uniref:Uncharacterized protein n=1 Tax=Lithospermum erythrorhizon TaxID=34254 RepID=A0AAV3REI7_LITER